MTVIKAYRNQTWDAEGNLVEDVEVQVDATADANDYEIRRQVRVDMQLNRAFANLPNPTNAQLLARVKSLTQQVNRLARLVLGDLEDVD